MKKYFNFLVLDKLQVFKRQIKNYKILSVDYGQLNTMKKWNCENREGNPIPWYTYPAIEYLNHIDFSDFKIFEYGSGNSSLYWSGKSKVLTSVEDNKEWYDKIKKNGDAQKKIFNYIYAPDKNVYINTIDEYDPDLVIIDGKWRSDCLNKTILKFNKSRNGKVLIFDNSDWYPKTIETLKKTLNWIQVDFHGFGPINNYTWTTSIFINPSVSGLKYKSNLMSIAGLNNNGDYE